MDDSGLGEVKYKAKLTHHSNWLAELVFEPWAALLWRSISGRDRTGENTSWTGENTSSWPEESPFPTTGIRYQEDSEIPFPPCSLSFPNANPTAHSEPH